MRLVQRTYGQHVNTELESLQLFSKKNFIYYISSFSSLLVGLFETWLKIMNNT